MERIIIGVWAIIMGLGVLIVGPQSKYGGGGPFFTFIGVVLLGIGALALIKGLQMRSQANKKAYGGTVSSERDDHKHYEID